MARPLEGIRVLDATHVYAGPTATRILSDLGADVIKVESTTRMDIVRATILLDNDTEGDFWNRGVYFLARNAGKRGITLNFQQLQGVELFKRLAAVADVVAESFTPRVMRNYGLHYEALRQVKPDLIYISLSGYGQTGPYRDFTAFGMGLEPASGISSITGYRGADPIRTGISFTDPVTGLIAAGAVLTALHYRRRTGKGQYIDLSEQEAAIPLIGYALMEYQMTGRIPERLGNRSPWALPQGCYRCRGEDNWLVLSVQNDAHWQGLCRASGHPEWESDDRFVDVVARSRHQDALDAAIESWTRTQDQYEAFHALQRAGVPAAPVLNPKQVLEDPHVRARELYEPVDVPGYGRRPVPQSLTAKSRRFAARPDRAAPKLGEHNREVLQGLLGLSDEELQQLEANGTIGTQPDIPPDYRVPHAPLRLPVERLKALGSVFDLDPDYRARLGVIRETDTGT